MSELSVSDLIKIYAFPKQDMSHLLMQIYESEENFFKYGELFLPMVTIVGKKSDRRPLLDSRALDAFEVLYQHKTGGALRYKNSADLKIEKVATQSHSETNTKKR